MILTSYSYKYKKNLHQTPWTSCKANGFFRCYNFNNWESTICQYTCIKNRIFISFDFFEHLKCFPFKMTPLPIMWLGSLFEQTWVLHHLRMIPHKVKFFWPIFLYRSLCTNLTPFHSLWPNSFSVEHDLNKFESSLLEDDSRQISTFLAKWFLEDFWHDTCNYSFYNQCVTLFDSGRIVPVMAFIWASDRWGMWRVFSGLIWTLSPSSGADRPSTRLSPVVSSVSLLGDCLTWPSSVERRLMLEFDPWDKDSDCTWRTFPRSWFSRACSFCQWIRIKWKQQNYL